MTRGHLLLLGLCRSQWELIDAGRGFEVETFQSQFLVQYSSAPGPTKQPKPRARSQPPYR